MKQNRRDFIKYVTFGTGTILLLPNIVFGEKSCEIQHPLMPPDATFVEECHNCGMRRSMWARTWYTYKHNGESLHTCSLHCMAEATMNSGEKAEDIQTALYLDPHAMIPAGSAFYVVGSSSRGTMTMKSKLAFLTKDEAEKFAGNCGGEVTDFNKALGIAKKSISQENSMINKNRMRKGKLVEPVDNQDVCPVCGMYAARYPKNKCQLTLKNGEVVHFCATQCLFAYLDNPQKYNKVGIKNNVIWVVDYDSGKWVYAPNAFYVIGSNARGPMGSEAFPFINKNTASIFLSSNKGKIVTFNEVTIQQILAL